jgi:hypothetical protein
MSLNTFRVKIVIPWHSMNICLSGCDALPSHEVKPTWGFHKVKLRKVETWRHAPGFQL